ncbi:hypothetical protein [Peptoniphilus olsenii]
MTLTKTVKANINTEKQEYINNITLIIGMFRASTTSGSFISL